jgi:demethylmenaquinone methyltransferase / 2-methoxy-6-polyprenyl-1,4-benzoquinol methylase
VPAGRGDLVVDVATGTGAVAVLLAQRGARVVGIDRSPEMLAAGRRRVAAAGLGDRVDLRLGEAERLPLPDGVTDGLTVSYLLRYVDDPGAVLRELARVVRPGGVLASLEFGVPPRPPARAAWRAYTGAVLPLAGAVVGGRPWWEAGRFLHRSIPGFYRRHPEGRLLALYRAAGLRSLRLRRLSLGGAVLISGVREG